MDSSRADDSEIPRLSELVNAVGDGALHFHIRDEEAAIARLPLSDIVPLARERTTRVAVAIYPIALWLPDLASAEPMQVPEDGRWQGWEWSADEHLLLCADRNPDLPWLPTLMTSPTDPRPRRMNLVGRPMSVRRASPGEPDSGWVSNTFLGEVHGFLDDATNFWVQAIARSAARRDELLAAVATLERTAP